MSVEMECFWRCSGKRGIRCLLLQVHTTTSCSLGRWEFHLGHLHCEWHFWGCSYGLQSEERAKIKKYDRLPGSRRCFLTARAWRLRIHHWTQAVMFKRCIMQHFLDHRSVDESHSTKMSCGHCIRWHYALKSGSIGWICWDNRILEFGAMGEGSKPVSFRMMF